MNVNLKTEIYRQFKSQKDFAKLVGLSDAQLSKIIRGRVKRRDPILEYRIAVKLGVGRDEIFPQG